MERLPNGWTSNWFRELALRHPEWHFVLAGDVFINDLRGLDRRPNVSLLGLLPFEKMPLLLHHFDVCIIPFKRNAITDAVDPVKLYEYLSVGKPVVATTLKEIEIYRDIITLADGVAEFEAGIRKELARGRSGAHCGTDSQCEEQSMVRPLRGNR